MFEGGLSWPFDTSCRFWIHKRMRKYMREHIFIERDLEETQQYRDRKVKERDRDTNKQVTPMT